LDIQGEKSASLELFGKPFELKCSQEEYLLCVYPEFTSEIISLVISLHDWLTLRALAADKNCISNTLLIRFSKSTERARAKKDLFGKLFQSARQLELFFL